MLLTAEVVHPLKNAPSIQLCLQVLGYLAHPQLLPMLVLLQKPRRSGACGALTTSCADPITIPATQGAKVTSLAARGWLRRGSSCSSGRDLHLSLCNF